MKRKRDVARIKISFCKERDLIIFETLLYLHYMPSKPYQHSVKLLKHENYHILTAELYHQ